MKNWTIRHRLLAGTGLTLALMLVMGVIAYTRLESVDADAVGLAGDAIPGVYHGTALRSELETNFSLTAEFLSVANQASQSRYEAELRASAEKIEEAVRNYETTIFQAKDRENFAAFKAQLPAYLQTQQRVVQLAADRKRQAIDALRDELDPAFRKTRAAIQVLVDFNHGNADQWLAEIRRDVKWATRGILASLLATFVVTVVCAYYLIKAIDRPLAKLVALVEVMRGGDFRKRIELLQRDEFQALASGFNRMADELTSLVGRVQTSSARVGASVNQIGATAREQQATASEIAATTSEIGATAKEISATARQLVRTMGEVSAVAEQTAALAGEGQAGLTRMGEGMQSVAAATEAISARLGVLSEKAGNIGQVVNTIAKVADQTNLLSLNAAIEAEKAGEAGRGFAVVATEIRRLADQTAVATYDIEQMVKAIQSAVAAGVMGMDKFSEEVRRGMHEVDEVGGQLAQIIGQVQALAPRIEEVNEGMQAQAGGAEQISEALTQLSEAARQTVDSLRESGQAIDEFRRVASELREGVSRFKVGAPDAEAAGAGDGLLAPSA